MKVAKSVSLVLLSFLAFAMLMGSALCAGPYDQDLLWTTDAVGTTEINEFWVGDPIYLRTNPGLLYPLPYNSQYRVYLFAGNTVLNNGDPIPGGALGLTPLDVSTDSNGQFGLTLIWDHAALGEYTIILDCLVYKGSTAADIGTYNEAHDFRDDMCTAVPTPPSFHVIPELGTIALLAGMFGSLGFFVVRKRKNRNHA